MKSSVQRRTTKKGGKDKKMLQSKNGQSQFD